MRCTAAATGGLCQEWTCNESSNQRWWKDADGALRPLFALDHCLGVPEGNVKPGTPVQVSMMPQSRCNSYARPVPADMQLERFRSLQLHAQVRLLNSICVVCP